MLPRPVPSFCTTDGSDKFLSYIELDLDSFLASALAVISEETSASGAILVVREADSLVIKAAAGSAASGVGLQLQASSGLCISTEMTQTSEDCAIDSRGDYSALVRAGARSAICIPLTRNQNTLGVFMLMSTKTTPLMHTAR